MTNLTESHLLGTMLGVAAGAGWSLTNLWVLSRLLAAWMTPTRSTPSTPLGAGRRAIGWLLLKLAVLYPLAFLFLRAAPYRAVSFGVGFTLVLGAAIGYVAVTAQRSIPHGR